MVHDELSRRTIGKYIEVWHYPDGHKELRLNDAVLPYSTCDRLQEIVERTAEIVMLMAKVITMCLCWIFSIFIAPVGLAYLYYYHSKGD
ncbi:hypothetical protein B6G11_01825 [Salmonella enterica]|nr:hypothetical protein [Salmonella enterica]EAQ5916358.1 hypothetical protein [Salmonella enterica subsp. enterica serovar Inverness]EAW1199700.1 hypothetical protein [Salmonella enterica subsp. enterica]EDR6193000.1 hypothetical protein [Salmonella enterica subsp. enterica serovar Aqua]EAA8173449.1 hypothetical protein [Salmonella enterica]